MTNVLSEAADRGDGPDFGWALREGLEALLLMVAPMMPHLGEECWRALGHQELLAEARWPELEPQLLQVETILLPVQVNGKKRAELTISAAASSAEVEAAALSLEQVQRFLEGRPPRKVVVVPNRIVNVVA